MSPRPNVQSIAVLGAITVVVVSLYWRFLNGYLWDDDFALIAAGRSFDPSWSFGVFNRNHFYRPLIELYFDFGFALFGYSTRAFHAANIGLHIGNAFLVYLIGRRLLRNTTHAVGAALVFAVLPGIRDTIAWVSAVTALLMTMCFLGSVLAHLVWLETRSRRAQGCCYGAFVAALLAHEAAVILLPTLVIAELLLSAPRPPVLTMVRRYAPFAVTLGVYLAISFAVNRDNYLVTEGHYRIGVHAIRNGFDYLAALYVGGRHATGYVLTGVAIVAAAAFGSRVAKFSVAWILLALLPYSFFTWNNSARYAYLAAVGFSLLLAAALQSLLAILRVRIGSARAAAATLVLATFVLVRFMTFAARGSANAVSPGEPYRHWLEAFRQSHADLPHGAVLRIDDPDVHGIDARGLIPLLQLEYGDPTLAIEIAPARH